MTEAEEKKITEETKRILNQDEIDKLLGAERREANQRDSIEAILNSNKASYGHLPKLKLVFDRLVHYLSISLRNFTDDSVEISVEHPTSTTFIDHLESLSLPVLVGVFGVKERDDSTALITVDSSLIGLIIDALLGTKRETTKVCVEEHSYTNIEKSLMKTFFGVVLRDFSSAFEPIASVNFELARLESNPNFAVIVKPETAAVAVKLNIVMENRSGSIEFLIPYFSFGSVQDTLLERFIGEKFDQVSAWKKHFADELWETRIPIKGVLKALTTDLNNVLGWKKGSQLLLNTKSDESIELKCGDLKIAQGKMHQKGSCIAIKIEENFINERKDS